jgi:hypothetical protein
MHWILGRLIFSLILLSGCELRTLPDSTIEFGQPDQAGIPVIPVLPDKSTSPKNNDNLDEIWNIVIGTCGCSTTPDGDPQSQRQFRSCARRAINDARAEGLVSSPDIRSLRANIQRSTCGRPDTAVTCCLRGIRQVGCGIRSSEEICLKPGPERTRTGASETCLDACRDVCWTHTHCDDGQPETLGTCNHKGICLQSPFQPNDEGHIPSPPGRQPHEFFGIRVIDTLGRPVAGVKLKTKHKLVLTSDDNGMVAFYEPELMNQQVYFAINSSRYSVAPDGFGFRGARLLAREGAVFELTVEESIDGVADNATYGTTATELLRGPVPEPSQLYHVRVIDQATGRGVPLAQLTHVSGTYVTDSLGNIAMMGTQSFFGTKTFAVTAHGYSFEHATVALDVTRGARVTLEMTRINIAERLYRVTGSGRYRHTRLLCLPIPQHADRQNGKVMGQDTVYTALYKERIFWLWGDTLDANGPLGVFHVAAAKSLLPAESNIDPDDGVLLDYFTAANGFVRAMAPPSTVPGDGATWMGGLVTVRDDDGDEHLFGTYGKFRHLRQLDCGMARFNDETELFERVAGLCHLPTKPHGHALTIAHDDGEYVYYYNDVRVRANPDSLSDPDAFEHYSPKDQAGRIVRDEVGQAVYDWRPGTSPLNLTDIATGQATADESLLGQMVSAIDGQRLNIHHNSTKGYSRHRQKYFQLLQRIGGPTSHLGDIWYSEADTPMGPWTYAVPILQHDQYTFYNPHYHMHFDGRDGRDIYFEATYTRAFAGSDAPERTARIDYNQFMYTLDLTRPEAMVPGAVYGQMDERSVMTFTNRYWLHGSDASPILPFMAYDRPREDLAPAWYTSAACDPARRLVVGGTPQTVPVFYAVPPGSNNTNRVLVPLKEARSREGRYEYSTNEDAPGDTIARVFPNPISVRLPVQDYLGELVADAGQDQCLTVANDRTTVLVELDATVSGPGLAQRFVWLGGTLARSS